MSWRKCLIPIFMMCLGVFDERDETVILQVLLDDKRHDGMLAKRKSCRLES